MSGTLYILGMGPGDPELLTLKAARILRASAVVAFFAKRGRRGHARRIAEGFLAPGAEELRLEYPFTTEMPLDDANYAARMAVFYDLSAARLAARLQEGRDVALLCEGDAFFYGSAMYIFDRLHRTYASEIVAGVAGMTGAWARARIPMAHGDDVLTVLPGTLDEASLVRHLAGSEAAVIMKVGRNLAKIRTALARSGRGGRAIYVERATMSEERIVALDDLAEAPAPYFSLVLVPGRQGPR